MESQSQNIGHTVCTISASVMERPGIVTPSKEVSGKPAAVAEKTARTVCPESAIPLPAARGGANLIIF